MQTNTTKKGQLSQGERKVIEVLRKNGKGKSCHFIGGELGRDPSIISREIQRNGEDKGRGIIKYSAQIAEYKRLERRYKANFQHIKLIKDKKIYQRFYKEFESHHKEWGVDEIVGFIRNSGEEMVCTSTIYNFIHSYKPKREYWLRYGKHGYRKRQGEPKKTALVGVPLIEERPEEINNRKTFGDWEIDTVVGPKREKGGLLTIIERQTRYTMIVKLRRATKEAVMKALINRLRGVKVNSITADNGSEFAGLFKVGKQLGCLVFRCHPYCSREKGTNERNNGIIRRYCPKTISIQQYSEEYIKEVERKINSKPRKILNYKSATSLFNDLNQS